MNIRDIVRVSEPGNTYNTYYTMAEYMQLSNWDKGELPKKDRVYEIITLARHGECSSNKEWAKDCDLYWSTEKRPNLAGIQDIETGKQYIVDIEALYTYPIEIFTTEDFKL